MTTDPKQSDKTAIQNPASSPVSPQPWAGNYPPAGEIDLVDIGVLLWRRRWLMLAVFLVFIILTIVATVLKRPTYEYSTTLQIGTAISRSSGNVLPMLSAQSVAQTLQSTYIPSAVNRYVSSNHPNQTTVQIPPITAVGDSNGYEVMLNCRAPVSLGSTCIAVEKIAADNFIKDNSRFVEAAQHQLASLQSQAGVLQSQVNKLDTATALLQQRTKALQQQIDRLQRTKNDAARKSANGSSAYFNTLLNVELLHATDSLNSTQQNTIVSILQQRDQLSQQLTDNLSAQQVQQERIDGSQIRTLDAGLRSLLPVGMSRHSLLGIGVLLSIILAFIAAFVSSFIERVRKRLAAETGN